MWLSAAEAIERLGITRATLYAYVSRGLIHSQAVPGKGRERQYSADDVERLRQRAEERKDPSKVAGRALHWGVPVLESAITLIADGHLYYRGHDVTDLARTRTVEEVAALIWTGTFDVTPFASTPLHVIAGAKTRDPLPFVNRAESILPIVAARDPMAFDLRPRSVAQTGWRIVNLLASVAAETSELAPSVEEMLAPDKKSVPLIKQALILSADHELNVSSFSARCVASAGSNPYAVVLAGLGAVEGIKHGGLSARIETMLDDLQKSKDLRGAITERMRRGEPVHGFGHPLYPAGDPRAAFLLDSVRDRFSLRVAAAVEDLLGEKPTIDFALVALQRMLQLAHGSALTLFALGRSIGWIGHAIEQYARDEIIRPRARYVGPSPASPAS